MALAALTGNKTVAKLSSEFGIHQTLIHKWTKQLKDSAAGIFAGAIKTEEARREKQLQTLHAKIGQLTVERDFFSRSLEEAVSVSRRQSMVRSDCTTLSVVRQCALLKISRSGLYSLPKGESALALALMQEIDRAFTEWSSSLNRVRMKRGEDYCSNGL